MNGELKSAKTQTLHAIHVSVSLLLNLMYTFSPISSQFSQFVFSLKMIVVSVVTPVICHVYHSWIKPVPLGNYRPGLTRVKVDVDQSTISRWRRKFRETGDVKDRPRSSRPRIITPDEDRYIRLVALRN